MSFWSELKRRHVVKVLIVYAAVAFVVIQAADLLIPALHLPAWLMTDQQASLVRFIIMGLALIALMVFRPQGIFGDRREIAIDGR